MKPNPAYHGKLWASVRADIRESEPTCSLGGSDLPWLQLTPASQLDIRRFPSAGAEHIRSEMTAWFRMLSKTHFR